MSINITQVRNAASLQADNLRMDVEIKHPQHGWIPYTLDPADTDTTIDNANLLELIGNSFAPYVAPTQEDLSAILAAEVRGKRDSLLRAVDAVVMNPLRWAALSEAEKAATATYRLALLNVPQQGGFPNDVLWPTWL